MRFHIKAIVLALLLCAAIVFGQSVPPGLWMYTDDYGQPLYSGIELVDTLSIGPPYTTHFGLAKDSITELRDDASSTDSTIRYYFSFPYQFTKGFAECKMMWEDRDWNWDATGYDSLLIKYIGPLQTHKVDIFFGEAIDRYSQAFLDSIGTLTSNYHSAYSDNAWRTVTMPLPPAPDGADRTNIREVRFIIHNAAGTTSLTSAVGAFDIDIVGLVAANTGVLSVYKGKSLLNNHLFFTPSISGTVALSIFSLNGKRLADKHILVVAGKKYSIKQFSSANINVSAAQVNIASIIGAGVNIREKIR
jgi:hypothetical protein